MLEIQHRQNQSDKEKVSQVRIVVKGQIQHGFSHSPEGKGLNAGAQGGARRLVGQAEVDDFKPKERLVGSVLHEVKKTFVQVLKLQTDVLVAGESSVPLNQVALVRVQQLKSQQDFHLAIHSRSVIDVEPVNPEEACGAVGIAAETK
ncbi:hypothetical protein EYF80_025837 [Liparis tanakae]|uniref:Uncharacterized protein n=1 Tax=Liparis tanakae TaxID=230148 RepID=A0A4Z2HFC6_9TELE|nr:hypothetical protein EYF80_025837 [Liparis tanakae]